MRAGVEKKKRRETKRIKESEGRAAENY